ncbi:MAG: hypothetical protein S4CHLAM7_11030 [Chlamydiae bacterium]|nr:hypothetical protein [Chlamydiota bacterium]
MTSYFSNYKAIGLTIDKYTIKYALISKSKNKISLLDTGSALLDCKTDLHSLKMLLNKHPSCALLPLGTGDLASLSHQIKKRTHLIAFLKNKLEANLLSSNIKFKSWPIKPNLLSYYAIKQENLQSIEDALNKSNLSFDVVSPQVRSISALYKVSQLRSPLEVWISFSEKQTEMVLIKNGNPIENFHLPCDSVQREEELLQFLYSLKQRYKEISNELNTLGNSPLKDRFISALSKKTPFKLNQVQLEGIPNKWLLEVGAALSLLKTNHNYFNFSPLEDKLGSAWRLYKVKALFSLTLILGLIVSHSLSGAIFVKQKKHKIASIYTRLLKNDLLTNQNLPSFLDLESESSLNQLESTLRSLQKSTPPYPLKPNTLLVSETLSWLKTVYDKLKLDSHSKPFFIENFDYKIISKPGGKKVKTPYLVKVSISFNVNSPEIARQLQACLLEDQTFVDQKKKKNWTFSNSLYSATFYLKNFPAHVQVLPCSHEIK